MSTNTINNTQQKLKTSDKLVCLPPEDQQRILDWLAEHPYHKVKELVGRPRPEGLGVEISISALGKFYHRHNDGPLDYSLSLPSGALAALPDQPLQQASFQALQQKALHETISPHVPLSGQMPIANFVVQLAQVKVRNQEQMLKEKHYNLARERFEYKAAREALKKLPELNKIHSTPHIDDEEKINQIRMEMFGCIAE